MEGVGRKSADLSAGECAGLGGGKRRGLTCSQDTNLVSAERENCASIQGANLTAVQRDKVPRFHDRDLDGVECCDGICGEAGSLCGGQGNDLTVGKCSCLGS